MLYFGCPQPERGWGGWTPVQRLIPLIDNQEARPFTDRRREGATCKTSTVNSDSHLEIGHQWSDQCHLSYFKCCTVPGLVCSHFFEASSRNQGNLYHGYSLVMMLLTSPPGGNFSIHRTWLRILSIAFEEELKILDYACWLNYYYLILLYCFLLFLHFFNFSDCIYSFTKVFHRQKVGWGHERQRPCSVSKGGSCSASKGDTALVSWIFCNCRMSTLADWSIDWLICSFIQDRESTNFLPDLRVSLLKCGPWTRTW